MIGEEKVKVRNISHNIKRGKETAFLLIQYSSLKISQKTCYMKNCNQIIDIKAIKAKN